MRIESLRILLIVYLRLAEISFVQYRPVYANSFHCIDKCWYLHTQDETCDEFSIVEDAMCMTCTCHAVPINTAQLVAANLVQTTFS